MIKLAGKSVHPSAVGESALGGKFVQISIGIIPCHLVCPLLRVLAHRKYRCTRSRPHLIDHNVTVHRKSDQFGQIIIVQYERF